MYHVRAQGFDERMINVHYYYYDNVDFGTAFILVSHRVPASSYTL